MGEEMCCAHKEGAFSSKKSWYQNSLFRIGMLTLVLLSASLWIPFLNPFYGAFFRYLKMIFWPVVAGFLLGGVVDHYIPHTYISKHLTTSRKRTIVNAVGLGFLMSACSHGILALSMELHKKGASGPAVVSFLLASPWANLPVTMLLFGFFGWKALIIVLGALVVALSTGLMLQALDRSGRIEKNPNMVAVDADFSIRKDIARRWHDYRFTVSDFLHDLQGVIKGAWSLADMVLGWILIGMILAGLSAAFVPSHFFHQFLGPTLLGLLITIGIATILEVCSEGTSPLAFEIYRQTGAFGNAFVFLMGGVVTDFTEIGLVWKNVGRRTALWMLGISLPQVILLGWIFNQVF